MNKKGMAAQLWKQYKRTLDEYDIGKRSAEYKAAWRDAIRSVAVAQGVYVEFCALDKGPAVGVQSA